VRSLFALLFLTACGHAGAVSEETGLVGVSVSPGSLAGTWAQFVETHTLVPVPVLGNQPGGGQSTRLITRTWDATSQTYTDTFTRCTNIIFPVQGVTTTVRDTTLSKIVPATYTATADHDKGSFSVVDAVDLWGAHNLPDPLTTDLPTKDNYMMSPQSDWVWDEDEDGHPGVTVFERGNLSADLYVIKRTIWTFDGTIIHPNRIQGLVKQTKGESNSLASTVSWATGSGSSQPDPSQLSWFDMTQLQDGAGCDAVAQALGDGNLSNVKPF
jgi:hypothetical protein